MVGMGAEDDTAARLHLLATHHLEPARTDTGQRRATRTQAPLPVDVDMLDHLTASVTEIVTQARTDAVAAHAADPSVTVAPRPVDDADVYAWWRAIPVSDQERQDERERVIYRQGLEHAIRAGDVRVVRRHPCPACGCYGLFWEPSQQAAICVNTYCRDSEGLSRSWPLGHLAYLHVAAQKNLARTATS